MDIVSFKMVGDWRAKMHTSLGWAIVVSQDVFGRSAGEACKHAVILMAQSARAITPIAKERRAILNDDRGEYVERWRQGWSNAQKIHKWMFSKVHDSKGNIIQVKNFTGSSMDDAGWAKAQIIRNHGLAKRAWMWGLTSWGGTEERGAIPGVSAVFFNQTAMKVEAIKQNKLNYINRIMPGGWENDVATKATNKIMAQAARKMERLFLSTLQGGNSLMAQSVQSFFLPEAA